MRQLGRHRYLGPLGYLDPLPDERQIGQRNLAHLVAAYLGARLPVQTARQHDHVPIDDRRLFEFDVAEHDRHVACHATGNLLVAIHDKDVAFGHAGLAQRQLTADNGQAAADLPVDLGIAVGHEYVAVDHAIVRHGQIAVKDAQVTVEGFPRLQRDILVDKDPSVIVDDPGLASPGSRCG